MEDAPPIDLVSEEKILLLTKELGEPRERDEVEVGDVSFLSCEGPRIWMRGREGGLGVA